MLDVLYEDNHCLVLNKPARLLTVADRTGDENLLDQAKQYLKEKYHKPGDVFLGVVQRLDRPVSGAVLFARTSKAASRLAEQFRTHQVSKRYWAVVRGRVTPTSAELHDWLSKDHQTNLVEVVSASAAGAQACDLSYHVLQQAPDKSLLEIQLGTGRSHQIRVQLSSRGWAILGDTKYGGPGGWEGRILLHARTLEFRHPTQQTPVLIEAPLPAHWSPAVPAHWLNSVQ